MANVENSVTAHAKTLDLALVDAAKKLGVEKDALDYELISKTDVGILSFLGGRKVEVKAWLKNAKKAQTKRPNRSNSHDDSDNADLNLEPLSENEVEKLVKDLADFCSGICGYIAGTPVHVDAKVESERLVLNIDDEYLAQQIAKNTRLAESLEHVLRKKPRYLKRELPFRIFVDARGIRTQREQELIDMAKDLSSKVVEKQRPIVLNYKSSYDRKIIHMALDSDDRVYTKSIGSGANRKLMILPAKGSAEALQKDSEYISE